ncbi:13765_t:CDS:2 [Funneliformis mosseae]|uniref:13765_t:CDS:1 n=1 Tax=Funneliformis mosseae TaxID=27381 RepID=A0A9N8YMQ7_FUNMO|nr:13765_t:CDS:2 [Funneliformis mosseae]
MPPLPAGLILDAEEQMAFEQMGGRNTITFNRLGDNQTNSSLHFTTLGD